MQATPTFEPEAVISAAKHQIISSNYKEVEQARSTVFSILDKCDETTSIALYLQFADLEIELRQFKQATKVLEQAVATRPLSLVLWKRYVGFCLDRQKHSNAKKLVVRAIELLPAETHAELWGILEQNEHTKADVEVLKAQVAAGTPLLTPAPPAVAPAATTSSSAPVTAAPGRAAPSIEPRDHKTTQYFDKLPATLPVIPDCPHLLFDPIDPAVALSPTVLYQLEDLARNEGVFREVARLYEAQRQKEVDTLSRWQDLIAMQMKEGSDLYRRHQSPDAKATESERHQFTLRAASSQSQFVDITAVDRSSQLEAQQRALAALRVPAMSVSKDSTVVTQQRRVVLWLLEAEKAWVQSRHQPQPRGAIDPRGPRRPSPRRAEELFHPYASRGRPHMQHRPMGGSDLYRRHQSPDAKATESERHQFTLRAASSQSQFVDITAVDRSSQLEAQQRALAALRVPAMSVSKDSTVVTQQRRVVLWLLEAEKAWAQSRHQPQPRGAIDPRRPSPRRAEELFHPYASRGRPHMQHRPMGGGRGRGGRR